MIEKLRVIRVVTSSECVPWHLGNTLKHLPDDFTVCVCGQNVSIHSAEFPNIYWVDIDIGRKIGSVSDVLALFKLCKLFINYRPDIVHSIMPKASLLAAVAGFLCRVPVRLHTFTGQVWMTKSGFIRKFIYWMDRIVVLLNTRCLTDSPSQSQFLFKNGFFYKNKPLPVLGIGSLVGVDLTRFDVDEIAVGARKLKEKLKLQDSAFIFSFIARKTKDKGCIDILLAFNLVLINNPNVHLLYVGPDESVGDLDVLKLKRPELFKNVTSIGRVSNHEEYLALSNVLCLPSYREGFGTIVIDAAAMGVPTIGSDIVGLVDSIDDQKTGILFPPGDIEQLAHLMLSCSRDETATRQMGQAARKRVEAYFTADVLYSALKDFYMQMSRESGGAGRTK